ncbi:LysR family transcriptional regulator [Actinomadura madurae]|uniref:DNA-binding transcriptional regulator, LysR family n=1 Tax=Actinomadura madurae TaxID=1993 RepID=A0A1I5CVJ1_9ACTN|nr:LysR family transcriptional regulator [Actinomadura madurae]SFN90958.1 DNA-binding transcriptional regulator, LysR family [Actinomadura madurae]SPT50564.1 Ben and cat operon transcriptional regulator [Actinomadura madurae]
MNLVGHLRCFVVVAEELHFGRAAERLGMAQPPLSQRIQRLEKELGVRLFDRSSRRVRLTAPGGLLLEEARDILVRVDRVYSVAERARLGELGTVRAGLPSDLAGPIVAALIAAFRERRPDLRLDLRETGTTEQVRALAEGALDAGVVRHPCDARDLELGPMLAQPLGVLVPAAGDLAAAPEVRLADLGGRALVVPPREEAPGAHDEVLAGCRRHGYAPAAVHEARHPGFALGLVLAGTAVALVPRTEDTAGVAWRPLAGEPLAWRTSCAWRRARDPEHARAIADFTAVATAVLRDEAGMTPLDGAPARRVVPRPSSGFLA